MHSKATKVKHKSPRVGVRDSNGKPAVGGRCVLADLQWIARPFGAHPKEYLRLTLWNVYGESAEMSTLFSGVNVPNNNLNGRVFRQHDESGINEYSYDFKGNVLMMTHTNTISWNRDLPGNYMLASLASPSGKSIE